MFFFVKQKTAYEMRISDWSSDVCSSDLQLRGQHRMAELKADLAGRKADFDIALGLVEQRADFTDAFARHDGVGHRLGIVGACDRKTREEVSVGRGGVQHLTHRFCGSWQEKSIIISAFSLLGNRQVQ